MKIDDYKEFLDAGTKQGQEGDVQSRYVTMREAFKNLPEHGVVIELGTTRSFVHGGLEGCNSDDERYWSPNDPSRWDWGAGCFTRVAAESLSPKGAIIHTVDACPSHVERCKIITMDLGSIQYHVSDSVAFILSFSGKADLVYVDTGDMTPIEPTALHQLKEAKAIVSTGIIPVGGLVLIDDVRNAAPKQFGDTTGLGKAKYSLAYLESNGFVRVIDEYQVLLRRTT